MPFVTTDQFKVEVDLQTGVKVTFTPTGLVFSFSWLDPEEWDETGLYLTEPNVGSGSTGDVGAFSLHEVKNEACQLAGSAAKAYAKSHRSKFD